MGRVRAAGAALVVLVVLGAHLSGSQQGLGECVCSPQGPPARCHSVPEWLLPVFPIKLPSLPQSCLLGVSEEGLGGIPQWGRDWRGSERALVWIRNGDTQERSCPPSHPDLGGLVRNLNPTLHGANPKSAGTALSRQGNLGRERMEGIQAGPRAQHCPSLTCPSSSYGM